MRLLTIGALALSIAAIGCSGGERMVASGATPATSGETPTPATSGVREVTIPAGTSFPIILDTPVGSDTSHAEEAVAAHLSQPLTMHGETLLPAGSRVGGVVTDAKPSGKVKGLAHISVRFDSLSERDGERYQIQTVAVGRTAEATKKKDALEIGAPAAGGAIIGGLLGGKKGALIGTAVGGGAGTAVVLSTSGREVHLNQGAILTLKLSEAVTVKVRG